MFVKGISNQSYSNGNGKKDQAITCRVCSAYQVYFLSGARISKQTIHCGGRKLDFACNACRSPDFVCRTSTFAVVSLSSDSMQVV